MKVLVHQSQTHSLNNALYFVILLQNKGCILYNLLYVIRNNYVTHSCLSIFLFVNLFCMLVSFLNCHLRLRPDGQFVVVFIHIYLFIFGRGGRNLNPYLDPKITYKSCKYQLIKETHLIYLDV